MLRESGEESLHSWRRREVDGMGMGKASVRFQQ